MSKVFDIEIYRNYFLIAFKDIDSGKVQTFEKYDGHPLDVDGVRRAIKGELVSFNGAGFDVPLLAFALEGSSTDQMKEVADDIILHGKKPWQVKAPSIDLDHIDLIEVAPGQASLKIYGGRLHCKRMQDLPIEPDATITPQQRDELRRYCVNDLDTTIELYNTLRPQIDLRRKMSLEYDIDLRSKSDAQIAEQVIRHGVCKITKEDVLRPKVKPGTVYKYSPPAMISFDTRPLRDVFNTVCAADFVVSDKGNVEMPDALADLRIEIGSSVYQLGIGGLHSTEESVAHVVGDDYVLVDRDVASYYPAIILNTGLTPSHLEEGFREVYKDIVDRRLAAKRSGDKVTADTLKIVINGSFGKFGSKWSILYSPQLLIQTTLTGQLALLMLIEALEGAGISVVSANTDGIVIKCPRTLTHEMDAIVCWWELWTGFQTEDVEYAALYSANVNNYIAVKKDGGVKLKGWYAPSGLAKNPTNEICNEAVVAFLANGTPVEETITACQDIRKFVTVKRVTGGAVKDGKYLGKAVRWYYADWEQGAIHYMKNGNKVGRSDGAKPLMDISARFPTDVCYAWYIAEAKSILKQIGVK